MEKILEKVEEGREEELDLADVRITVLSILVKTTALIYLCVICVLHFFVFMLLYLCIHHCAYIHILLPAIFVKLNMCICEYVCTR